MSASLVEPARDHDTTPRAGRLGARLPMKVAWPRRLGVAPLAIALFSAQAISMSIVNFFELPGWAVGVLLPLLTIVLAALVHSLDLPIPRLTRSSHAVALLIAMILSAPRLTYVFQPVFGFSVNAVVPDDWWHFQEIAALAYTPTYPAVSTFSGDHLLGFYYAAWMLPAALFKISHGLLTVASAYGLSTLIYNVIFAYWVLYAAALAFRSARERAIFSLIAFSYGGFSFISALLHPETLLRFPSAAEDWLHNFGFNVQFSSFATLALWTPHHLVACLAALTAIWVALNTSGSRAIGGIVAGSLLTFATFASIFATIGALPIVACIVLVRRTWTPILIALATAALLSAPLAWIYLAHSSASSGFIPFGALSPENSDNRELALLTYCLLLVLQFGPLFVAARYGSTDDRLKRALLITAVLFIGSTFVLAFVGFNNYPARGSTASVLALAWLGTPTLARWSGRQLGWAITVAAAYSLGGVLSLASVIGGTILAVDSSDTPFNRAALVQNTSREGLGSSTTAEVPPDFRWYLVDNHLNNPKRIVLYQDGEIMVEDSALRIRAPWLSR